MNKIKMYSFLMYFLCLIHSPIFVFTFFFFFLFQLICVEMMYSCGPDEKQGWYVTFMLDWGYIQHMQQCVIMVCVFQSGSGSPVGHRSAGLRLGLPPPPSSSSSSSHADVDSKRGGSDQTGAGRTRRVSRAKAKHAPSSLCSF